MIDETIAKIEAKIQKVNSVKDENKKELLNLLGTLKIEISELAKTHAEQAQSIAAFTEVSTHEATRQEKNPELLELSVRGLESSVHGFETSHPQLVEIVNAFCLMLSNMGI